MKRLISIIATITLVANNIQASESVLLKANKLNDKSAVIIVFDIAGLNNANSNNALFKQNLSKCNEIVTKHNLQRAKVRRLSYYTLDEQIRSVGSITSNKAGKLYRTSKQIMQDVIFKVQEDHSKQAKDVISVFSFLNSLVEQSYSEYNKIYVVVFSNLRDTVTTKHERESMPPITMDKKVHLFLFAASGLNGIKGVTASQQMVAESSVVDFYRHLLVGSVVIKTTY